MHQRIWATALAVSALASSSVVIIAVDTLGVPDVLAQTASASVHETHSLPRERLVITVASDRGVELPAAQAEIRGNNIKFEQPIQNIGYWQDADDQVSWRVASAGEYQFAVWCEWAYAPDAAGNGYRLEGAKPENSSRVRAALNTEDRHSDVRTSMAVVSNRDCH